LQQQSGVIVEGEDVHGPEVRSDGDRLPAGDHADRAVLVVDAVDQVDGRGRWYGGS
jgi:hypothetical protein